MHIVEASSQWPDGRHPRAFVPLDVAFAVAGESGLQRRSSIACVDSGADRALIPRHCLPREIRWEHLTRTAIKHDVIPPRDFEFRIWHADLSVFGVTISNEVLVADLDDRLYPVLGLADIFRHFNIGFAWANQPSPIVTFDPHGQVEAQVTTRWRVDPAANTWKGVAQFADPSLAGTGLRISTTEPWTGRMPRIEPLYPDAPRLIEPPRLNREQRRRLRMG